MIISDRRRALREKKHLAQGDIEKRTGLLRCYISRVENGHTVPALETLEKFAHAMQVPLYELFHDGEKPPALLRLGGGKRVNGDCWGSAGKDARVLHRFRGLVSRIKEPDRNLLLHTASKMASSTRRREKA
jgi:transcriptional regulator with XRE-family HTH domain